MKASGYPGRASGGRLVGLTGLAGSGKSTASSVLTDGGWQLVKLAGPLKSMAARLFQDCGLDPDRCIEGDLKETSMDELNGKSPRHVMQTLGTEWGRNCMSETFWVDIASRNCRALMDVGTDVVVDDVRFQNEADMIRDLGGVVVAVIGRGGISGVHASEKGVAPDFTIENNRTIGSFRADVNYILNCTHS